MGGRSGSPPRIHVAQSSEQNQLVSEVMETGGFGPPTSRIPVALYEEGERAGPINRERALLRDRNAVQAGFRKRVCAVKRAFRVGFVY